MARRLGELTARPAAFASGELSYDRCALPPGSPPDENEEELLRLETRPLREASDWLELHRSLWEAKFAAVERHLAESEEEEPA